jgi:hypothetical protein
VDFGYQGLARDLPAQVSAPPKPGMDALPGQTAASARGQADLPSPAWIFPGPADGGRPGVCCAAIARLRRRRSGSRPRRSRTPGP